MAHVCLPCFDVIGLEYSILLICYNKCTYSLIYFESQNRTGPRLCKTEKLTISDQCIGLCDPYLKCVLMLHTFGLVTSCLPEVNYLYLRFHEKCPYSKSTV